MLARQHNREGRAEMGKLATEDLDKRLAIREKIDSVIESVGAKIQNGDVVPGEYANTVMALAALVEARARLI